MEIKIVVVNHNNVMKYVDMCMSLNNICKENMKFVDMKMIDLLYYVLKRDMSNILGKAVDFEVRGIRKSGRPKRTWLLIVVEQGEKAWLKESEAKI